MAARSALAIVASLVVALALPAPIGDDHPPPAERQSTPSRAKAARPLHLTVSVSGDLLIHTPVWERALALGGGGSYDFAALLREVRPYVAGASLAICHVETPMTSAAPTSYPIFNTPPALAEGIAATGWDACDTASNHSLDQHQEGIVATGQALDRAGVEHTGSFSSPSAERRPLILEVKGVRIALIAYTTDTNGIPPPSPWSVNVSAGPAPILAAARRAHRHGADAVIVNLHWGGGIVPEYRAEPTGGEIGLVKALTASRAVTAVVGQGPHAVQPIWLVNRKYVVFSEGNLISNQGAAVGLPAASQDGLIAILRLVANEGRVRVSGVDYVPVWVSHPDYEVLPVGTALRRDGADPAALRASYERTVSVVGRGNGKSPVPAKLPR